MQETGLCAIADPATTPGACLCEVLDPTQTETLDGTENANLAQTQISNLVTTQNSNFDPTQNFPDSPLRQAYRGQRPDRTPVWFMGQTVTEKPADRDEWPVEKRVDWKLDPVRAARDAIRPIEEFGVDATPCFPDVLLAVRMAGINWRRGIGPDGHKILPVRSGLTVERILDLPEPDWDRVTETVAHIRAQMPREAALIAVGAAPFVTASILVEGTDRLSQNLQTRVFLQSQPRNWERLIRWCEQLMRKFLRAQVQGGAEVIQLVDPWVRILTEGEYKAMAEPYARAIFETFPDVTKIYCNPGADHLLGTIAPYVDVLGVGIDLSLVEAAQMAPEKVLQGNLDPNVFFMGMGAMRERAQEILTQGLCAPAHVFNCGDALPPEADPAEVRALVDYIHNLEL